MVESGLIVRHRARVAAATGFRAREETVKTHFLWKESGFLLPPDFPLSNLPWRNGR